MYRPCALVQVDGVIAVHLNLLIISSDLLAVKVISLFHVDGILEGRRLGGKHGAHAARCKLAVG